MPGIDCLDDSAGVDGFHHAQARHGQYRYEFYGFHHTGLARVVAPQVSPAAYSPG